MQLKKGKVETFDVEEMAYGGKGISKVATDRGDFIVFIPNTIPGQKVLARIVKTSRRHAEARLLRVVEPSSLESDIPYQTVSGAPFAKVAMERQRFWKQRDSLAQFERNGIPEIHEVFRAFLSSPKDWCYRNKMEYSFSAITWDHDKEEAVDRFGFGFKRRGMWWCVEDLDKPSGLFDSRFEEELKKIRAYCEATGLPPWHAPQRKGFFRTLMVRYSFHEDAFLFCLQTTSDDLDQFDLPAFADFLESLIPGRMAGFIHCVNDEEGDRFDFEKQKLTLIKGKDTITERISGLDFDISLSSFFQTNPASAEVLYAQVSDYVKEFGSAGKVMDLFCGTGTIAQLLASTSGEEVIGVDIVESAIEDAQRNAKRNGVDGVQFFASDIGHFLRDHPEYQGKIGTIVLDPPRAGITPKSLNKVIALDAPSIIYVSCNPATQARDVIRLKEAGYALKAYHLVDQFPHTSHIEGIAALVKG